MKIHPEHECDIVMPGSEEWKDIVVPTGSKKFIKPTPHLTDEQEDELAKFQAGLEISDADVPDIPVAKKPNITLFDFLSAIADYLRTDSAKDLYGNGYVQIQNDTVEVTLPGHPIAKVHIPVHIFVKDILRDDCNYAELVKSMVEYA